MKNSRLIHNTARLAKSLNSAKRINFLAQSLPNNDTHVLNAVMKIHVQITLAD